MVGAIQFNEFCMWDVFRQETPSLNADRGILHSVQNEAGDANRRQDIVNVDLAIHPH